MSIKVAIILACLNHSYALCKESSIPIIDVPMTADETKRPNALSHSRFLKSYDSRVVSRCPKPFIYKADAKLDNTNAFIIAGMNSPEKLARIKGVTGVSWDLLNKRAQKANYDAADWFPGADPKQRGSMYGFVRDKSVQDLIIDDTKNVVSMNLTHQLLAAPLVQAIEAIEQAPVISGKKQNQARFTFNNRTYIVDAVNDECVFRKDGDCPKSNLWSGWSNSGQGTPFNDKIFSSWYGKITDSETGETINIDSLTPHMICRYGFYQGSEFRIPPEKIAKFFRLNDKIRSSSEPSNSSAGALPE